MSTLIVQLPAQPRARPSLTPDAPVTEDPLELEYVVTSDGRKARKRGRALAAELPSAQEVVAVLAPEDLGWHQITLPKAPGSRMRQALASMLEDTLLEDEGELHLALSPEAEIGELSWVACTNKAWLQTQIQQLEATGMTVDRVVPGWAPGGPPAAHVYQGERGLMLAWRDAQGVLCMPMRSTLARVLVVRSDHGEPPAWSSCLEGAQEAAALAGTNVQVEKPAKRLLLAAASAWNLRQYDLSAQRRSQRAAREAFSRFWTDPVWRPLRLGMVGLLAIQMLGANLWAWQQRSTLNDRRNALHSLLQATFPNVRAVFDAPAQMQKEIDLLRTAAGKPGDLDLEPLLYAAEAAWPPQHGPADEIHYESNKLTLQSAGWTAEELATMNSRLRALGLEAEAVPGGLAITRARQTLPSGAGAAPGAGPAGGAPAPAKLSENREAPAPVAAAPVSPSPAPAAANPPPPPPPPPAVTQVAAVQPRPPGGRPVPGTGLAPIGAPGMPGGMPPGMNGGRPRTGPLQIGGLAAPGFTSPGGNPPAGHPGQQPTRPEDQ